MIREKLTAEQRHGRALNAVLGLMQRRLIVPKIFLNAPWPNRQHRVDLLAVDRAGSGEIHVVEVKTKIADAAVEHLIELPAHYKYLALLSESNYRLKPQSLYALDGLGRIGLVSFHENALGELGAILDIPPERFDLSPEYFKHIDRLTSKLQPNWEVRY